MTPEFMAELDEILEERALFDDFSKELAEGLVPIKIAPAQDESAREFYLKERRRFPDVALPESVTE